MLATCWCHAHTVPVSCAQHTHFPTLLYWSCRWAHWAGQQIGLPTARCYGHRTCLRSLLANQSGCCSGGLGGLGGSRAAVSVLEANHIQGDGDEFVGLCSLTEFDKKNIGCERFPCLGLDHPSGSQSCPKGSFLCVSPSS